MAITRRQLLAVTAYAFSRCGKVTQAEIAKRFGISQPALSRRLSRFKA